MEYRNAFSGPPPRLQDYSYPAGLSQYPQFSIPYESAYLPRGYPKQDIYSSPLDMEFRSDPIFQKRFPNRDLYQDYQQPFKIHKVNSLQMLKPSKYYPESFDNMTKDIYKGNDFYNYFGQRRHQNLSASLNSEFIQRQEPNYLGTNKRLYQPQMQGRQYFWNRSNSFYGGNKFLQPRFLHQYGPLQDTKKRYFNDNTGKYKPSYRTSFPQRNIFTQRPQSSSEYLLNRYKPANSMGQQFMHYNKSNKRHQSYNNQPSYLERNQRFANRKQQYQPRQYYPRQRHIKTNNQRQYLRPQRMSLDQKPLQERGYNKFKYGYEKPYQRNYQRGNQRQSQREYQKLQQKGEGYERRYGEGEYRGQYNLNKKGKLSQSYQPSKFKDKESQQ